VVNIYEAGPFEGRLEQWPVLATSGDLEVRLAETDLEVEQAQRLRYTVFYEEMSAVPSAQVRAAGRDFDKFDDVCDHLLVVDRSAHNEDGQPLVVGTYRLTREHDAARVGGFYTAGEYDIAPMLRGMPEGTKFLELGRSCVLKSYRSRPGSMQLLWKGLMAGTNPAALALPLAYLHHFHAMPEHLRVRARPELFVPMDSLAKDSFDAREGLRALPPMLKGYVRAGCCIGDGAVVDKQFGTTDVFIFFPLSGIDARYKSRFGLVK
jgi:L-ornithine Nalpha-acyltransferase